MSSINLFGKKASKMFPINWRKWR